MIKGSVEGIEVVLADLDNAALEVRQAAFQGVLLALNAAFKACATVLSPADHTLKQLAEMGHPYSAAHGHAVHNPDVLVHLQSGKYRDALKKISPQGRFGQIIEGSIVIDETLADLDRWVQEGTTKMRARPWMQWVVDHYGDDFARIIEASVSAALRGHAA
jgi:hypothetical protein